MGTVDYSAISAIDFVANEHERLDGFLAYLQNSGQIHLLMGEDDWLDKYQEWISWQNREE